MDFFNLNAPLLVRKKSAYDCPSMPGLWRFHWRYQGRVLYSSFYTRHDQACLMWGAIATLIFLSAQFLPLSWTTQALLASSLTGLGVVGMALLTWRYVHFERLNWALASWAGLMMSGAIATYQGVFGGWTWALLHICALWLGLSGIGYLVTGIGMRSRLFLLLAFIHLLAIGILPLVPVWKPLVTGLVISLSAFLIAEFQWDADGVCGYQVQEMEMPGMKMEQSA